MKQLFLLLTLTLCLTSLTAQENTTNRKTEKTSIFERKHEVKLGAIKMLAGPIFEGGYEYILDTNQGFGAYLLLNLDSSNEWFEDYSLTPFYRFYFQKNEQYGAKGFFVEGFSSFFIDDDEEFSFDQNGNIIYNDSSSFDIGLGIALGQKWVNTAGFVLEIKLGAGRNLLGNTSNDAIIKADFYLGYRF